MGFSERIDTILNWTDLVSVSSSDSHTIPPVNTVPRAGQINGLYYPVLELVLPSTGIGIISGIGICITLYWNLYYIVLEFVLPCTGIWITLYCNWYYLVLEFYYLV